MSPATDRVDAVVVGGGHNGLCAAIRLARAGWSVVVCEAEATLGGAVRTEELTLPGFRHDTFSAVHPAGAASPVLERLPLAEHGLEWVHPPVAMAHPLPDGRAAALHRDLDRTVEGLEDLQPGDGLGWKTFAGPLVDAFDAFRSTVLGGFPPLRGAAGLLRRLGLTGVLELGRVALHSVEGLAAELFTGPHARAWLAGSAMHGDVPTTGAGSAIVGVYMTVFGHGVGWPSPRGGAGALVDALAGHLRALGGEVRTATPVERIITDGHRVGGVVTAAGDRLRAPVVIADTTPQGLVELVGARMPLDYLARVGRFRPGPGTVKVDWALSGPIPWTAEVARRAGTVHVGGGPEELRAHSAAVAAGELSERPFLLSGQQSLADPSRAPEGRHTAWAYTRVPASLTQPSAVLAHVERMEQQMERFAPGFRDLVLARHVSGPRDLHARNPNLVAGDVGGGSYSLEQTIFRPLPALVPYATPIRGLWLGSASTFPGGGVHGVPGWTAARLALLARKVGR